MPPSLKLDPDGTPAYLKLHDEPVTDENRMRRLPEHIPVPVRAQRKRVQPSAKAPDHQQEPSNAVPNFLLRSPK
jgi:hypothetical protein